MYLFTSPSIHPSVCLPAYLSIKRNNVGDAESKPPRGCPETSIEIRKLFVVLYVLCYISCIM